MWSFSNFCAVIFGTWAVFHLLHNFLIGNGFCGNSIEHYLENNNISISPFHVRWFSKRLNRLFFKIGKKYNLSLWFNAGVFFACFAMVISSMLLSHMLMHSFKKLPFFEQEKKVESSQVLKVVVPGVNLPAHDIGYLAIAILIAGILHEMGHAVAAVREGVQVNGFGVFLFFIYPGAFVDLNSDDLSRSNPLKQLRIYCAGVWHNFILCIISCIFIFFLPWFLFPFYSTNGAIVTFQLKTSPLVGDKGIEVGDTVKKIGSCSVFGVDSWLDCINKTSHFPQMGSCASLNDVHSMDVLNEAWKPNNYNKQSEFHCCSQAFSQTHLCYSYSLLPTQSFACLPGRMMMSQKDCVTTDDCKQDDNHNDKSVCVTPHIDDLSIRFTRVVVKRGFSHYHVLYYGNPKDLAAYITVSDLTPRSSIIPLSAPAVLLKFFQYIFSMSGALALLNIVPCYALDGEYAFKAFVDFFFAESKTLPFRNKVCSIFLNLGTVLVAFNVVFGLLFVSLNY